MLEVYDKNGNYIRGIVDYKDARIEQELNITDTLLFNIPKSLGDIFEEEGYVETKEDGRFVIKEKNLTNDGYEIVGKYDLEDLLEWVESESYVTMNIIDMFNDLLEGTGWAAKYGDEWGRNLLWNTSFRTTQYWSGVSEIVDGYNGLGGFVNERTNYTGNEGRKFLYQTTSHVNVKRLQDGETYTLSGWFYMDSAVPQDTSSTSIFVRKYDADNSKFENFINIPIKDTEYEYDKWYYFEQTGTIPDGYTGMEEVSLALGGNGRIIISGLKLEKGSAATPWSPAPEDLTLPKRTVTGTNMSILEFIYKAVDTFKYDIRFDNKTKTIYVADELALIKVSIFMMRLILRALTLRLIRMTLLQGLFQ